jgi:hypothetical protein
VSNRGPERDNVVEWKGIGWWGFEIKCYFTSERKEERIE